MTVGLVVLGTAAGVGATISGGVGSDQTAEEVAIDEIRAKVESLVESAEAADVDWAHPGSSATSIGNELQAHGGREIETRSGPTEMRWQFLLVGYGERSGFFAGEESVTVGACVELSLRPDATGVATSDCTFPPGFLDTNRAWDITVEDVIPDDGR